MLSSKKKVFFVNLHDAAMANNDLGFFIYGQFVITNPHADEIKTLTLESTLPTFSHPMEMKEKVKRRNKSKSKGIEKRFKTLVLRERERATVSFLSFKTPCQPLRKRERSGTHKRKIAHWKSLKGS